MRGRKPTPSNVIPLTGAKVVKLTPAQLVKKLRPRGLSKDETKEWNRVALILADPTLDRLKPHFVDTIIEYCRAVIRLRELRQWFVDNTVTEGPGAGPLSAEIYEVEGRNGVQIKSHPHVAQLNETWRQWRSLMMECGLSIASERNMIPGQGNLFDDPAEQYMGGGAG